MKLNKLYEQGYIAGAIALIAAGIVLLVAAVVGYIVNFIDVIQLATGSLAGTTMYFILKFVGIFVPFIGAIMGYF